MFDYDSQAYQLNGSNGDAQGMNPTYLASGSGELYHLQWQPPSEGDSPLPDQPRDFLDARIAASVTALDRRLAQRRMLTTLLNVAGLESLDYL